MDGVLIIDKPVGPTSHDIVQEIKRLLGAKKVGHLGTLDPAATGVLPLVINEATKFANKLSGGIKIYEFDLVLGISTDTDDDQGKIVNSAPVPENVINKLKDVLQEFIGDISQVPPAYSAVKVNGRPLYKDARADKPVQAQPRNVIIHELSITSPIGGEACPERSRRDQSGGDHFFIPMRLTCDPGTYVRALCRDIGAKLDCLGHAANIRRLQSGRYTLEDAVKLNYFRNLTMSERHRLISKF